MVEEACHELEALRQATNPGAAARTACSAAGLWRLPNATPGRTESALSSLFDPNTLEEGGHLAIAQRIEGTDPR